MTMLPDDIEEWRFVPNTFEYYEVSNWGRVRRAVNAPHASTGITWPGRVMKPQFGHRGYGYVSLSVYGKARHRLVHLVVADAFLPPKPTPQHTVNHVDGNKSNNRSTNLAWATHLEQTQHAIALGLMDRSHLKQFTLRGEQHHQAKLTEEIVRVIRYAPSRFSSLDLAELFGIGTSQVSRIQNRQAWKHLD